MCGKEAIGVSVGDIGTWTYTMAECRVLKIGKKYERKTERILCYHGDKRCDCHCLQMDQVRTISMIAGLSMSKGSLLLLQYLYPVPSFTGSADAPSRIALRNWSATLVLML